MKVIITFVITSFIVTICLLLFSRTSYIWLINRARRKGIPNNQNKATIEDIKELLRSNEREAAVSLYSQMYGLNVEQSQREVGLLERTLLKEDRNH